MSSDQKRRFHKAQVGKVGLAAAERAFRARRLGLPWSPLAFATALLLLAGCASREDVFNRELKEANDKVNAGEFAEAIEILVPLNEERAGYKPVVEALAFAYAGNGDDTLAAWHMIQLADLDPSQPDLRLLAAEALERAGDPQSAAEQFRLYLKTHTQDAQAWQQLAELCQATGDTRGAIEALLARQTLDPSPENAFVLGELFRQLNNLPQAQVWYATAVKQGAPQADLARLNLLELSLAERDFQQADDLAASLKGKLSDPGQVERLADYQKQIDAWKASRVSLSTARKEQERLAAEVERLRLEQERIAAEDAQRAKEEARAAELAAQRAREQQQKTQPTPTRQNPTQTGPANPGAEGDGDRLAASGDFKGAVDAYWKALNNDSEKSGLWLKLARTYASLQQWTEAESCLLEARRRDRQNPQVELVYLQIVRRTRTYDEFLVETESARNRYPQSPDIVYLLAESYSATGTNTIQAIRAYEDFLLLAPPDDPRRQAAQTTIDRLRGW